MSLVEHNSRIQSHHEVVPGKENFYINTPQGKLVAKNPRANIYNVRHPQIFTLNPESAVITGAAVNNNSIYFRIRPKQISGEMHMACFEWELSETAGTQSITPIAAPNQIDTIKVFYGSIGTPVQVQHGDSIYTTLNFTSDNELDLLCAFNKLNMTRATLRTPTAIAASGVHTYSVPLFTSILNQIDVDHLDNDVIVEFKFLANPVSAGTGVLGLNSIKLKLYTDESPMHKQSVSALYQNNQFLIPFIEPNIVEETVTLTQSQNYDMRLQLEGLFSCLTVCIRSSKAVASSAINNFATISGGAATSNLEFSTGSLDLISPNKVTILGSGAACPATFRTELGILHGLGDMGLLIPQYHIIMSEGNFAETLKTGVKSGSIALANNHYLRLGLGSSFTTGSYVVTVIGWRYREAIQGGKSLKVIM